MAWGKESVASTVSQQKDRWKKMIFQCRNKDAMSLPLKRDGISFGNIPKKVYPALKFPPKTGTRFKKSKRMPPRAFSISYWFSCLTGLAVKKMRLLLSWSGLLKMALRSGAPWRASRGLIRTWTSS